MIVAVEHAPVFPTVLVDLKVMMAVAMYAPASLTVLVEWIATTAAAIRVCALLNLAAYLYAMPPLVLMAVAAHAVVSLWVLVAKPLFTAYLTAEIEPMDHPMVVAVLAIL